VWVCVCDIISMNCFGIGGSPDMGDVMYSLNRILGVCVYNNGIVYYTITMYKVCCLTC